MARAPDPRRLDSVRGYRLNTVSSLRADYRRLECDLLTLVAAGGGSSPEATALGSRLLQVAADLRAFGVGEWAVGAMLDATRRRAGIEAAAHIGARVLQDAGSVAVALRLVERVISASDLPAADKQEALRLAKARIKQQSR